MVKRTAHNGFYKGSTPFGPKGLIICPFGGIGRHDGLKIHSFRRFRFKSENG